MGQTVLQFEGVTGTSLPLILVAAIGAILAMAGVWQLMVVRRIRRGLLYLAAVLGPVTMVPALLIDAWLANRQNNRKQGRLSWTLAVLLAGATTIAAALVVLSGKSLPVFWACVLTIQIPLAIGVFYASAFSHLGTRRLAGLMALRCGTIGLLLCALFKPVLVTTTSDQDQRPDLPILVDRSASMGVTDQQSLSRYQQVIQRLLTQQARLEQHFRPVWKHFATSTGSVETPDAFLQLKPSGPDAQQTNLAQAIRTAAAYYTPNRIPGLLVLTDGNISSQQKALAAARETGVPVFAVGTGQPGESQSTRPNMEIVSAEAPYEVALDNISYVSVVVRATGMEGQASQINIAENGSDQPLATQSIAWTSNDDTRTLRLPYRPKAKEKDHPDLRKLRINLPGKPGEITLYDNTYDLHVIVTRPRIRVLYIEGRMRPEYRFLKRAFDSDPNIQFQSLVRWGKAKFSAYGSLGKRKLLQLPTTDADFDLFDVLIVGDLDRTFLAGDDQGPARLNRIKKFVEDGGGFLMLGGDNSFGPGGYQKTPIEEILPVEVGSRSQKQETAAFLPQLTAVGMKHPIFHGISDFFPGPSGKVTSELAERLPDLRGCVTVLRSKPSAEVLAVHPTRANENGPLVVLACRRFVGEGRTCAFTADTTWQWYMRMRGLGLQTPYLRFWGQMVRWLAGVSVKERQGKASVLLRVDHQYRQEGQPIRIMARVRDDKGQADPKLKVFCTLEGPEDSGKPRSSLLGYRPATTLFEAPQFKLPTAGQWKVRVNARDGDSDKLLGSDELTIRVAGHQAEMDRLGRNDEFLTELANETKGSFRTLEDLGQLVDELINQARAQAGPGPKIGKTPLYFFPVTLVGLCGLLTAEWILRRRWQLT